MAVLLCVTGEQNSASSAYARDKTKSYLGQLLKKDVVLYLHFLRCHQYALDAIAGHAAKGGECHVIDVLCINVFCRI